MQRKTSKILILTLLLAVLCSSLFGFLPTITYAQDSPYYNGNYYAGIVTTKTGNAMLQELRTLITETHTKQTNYDDDLVKAFRTADADPNNSGNILWFYTGTSVPFSGFGGSVGDTNREHVWPKDGGSAFPEKSGPGSDAHHLRPTDTQLNSTRGSLSFNEVDQTTSNIVKQNGSTSYGNSANGKDALCYKSGSFFYPAKGYRGATARILLYMYVRWGGQYNLTFVDSAGSCKTIGKISTLLKWHYEEEPTDAEIRRNEAVYEIQGNRNPFIDHPEWATTILCDSGESYSNACKTIASTYNNYDDQGGSNNIKPTSLTPSTYLLTMTKGQSQVVTVTATPSEASNAVTFESQNPSVATVDANGAVTALADGETQIVITSAVNTNIKTYVRVVVKKATKMEVSGTPQKLEYFEGQAFDPKGLTVTVFYDDQSTNVLALTDCKWLDANTNAETLSQGTQSVICKYGNLSFTINGITVGQSQSQKVTVTRSNFEDATGSYAWLSWQSGSLSGKAFVYPGAKDKLQFNSDKFYKHLYGSAPAPITSVTVYLKEGTKSWELFTSSNAFTSATPSSSTATSHGAKNVTTTGVTWNLTGNDTSFALSYKASGVCYIDKIEITYGGSASSETPPAQDTVSLNKTSANMKVGDSLTLTATASGSVSWNSSNANVATVSNGVVTAVGTGTATVTVTCGTATATCIVTVSSATCNHVSGSWIVGKVATCFQTGLRHKICTLCGETTEQEVVAKLAHTESGWKVDLQPTCDDVGKRHTECTVCHEIIKTESIAKTENHDFCEWQTTVPPTAETEGTEIRTCVVCGKTETRAIEKLPETLAFTQAVLAIANAQTLEQKFECICSAVTIYNGYTEEQKQLVTEDFATLKGYVQAYNNQIATQNQASTKAQNTAIATLSATVTAVALAVVLTLKRYL